MSKVTFGIVVLVLILLSSVFYLMMGKRQTIAPTVNTGSGETISSPSATTQEKSP
ncbi:MAG: hypothetical protein WD231_03510 [Candidatus Woykebacteria bacterium]